MIDGNGLIYRLLQPFALEVGAALKPDIEVNSIDKMPLATFTGRPGTSIGNDGGPVPPTGWYWGLDMSIFCESHDEAKRVSHLFYDRIRRWNEWPQEGLNQLRGLGTVNAVTDRSVFARLMSSDIPGHKVTQFVGAFDLQLYSA